MALTFEGMTLQELESMSRADWDALVLVGEPISFQAGSAEILGQFWIEGRVLVLELAQIDGGGGEGLLVSLWRLAGRQARVWGLDAIDWRAHAVHCANPNLRLRRTLERRGFTVQEVDGVEVYRRIEPVEAGAD